MAAKLIEGLVMLFSHTVRYQMEPHALCGLGLQFVPLLQFTAAMNMNEAGRRCCL